jgi:hypothetical protein
MADQVHLDSTLPRAWAPVPPASPMDATPWSLHLADSRGRAGQAAALGPEGGRLAPLPPGRQGRPAGMVGSGRRGR